MKYLIDANVFLQTALGQEKGQNCRKLLDRISEGDIQAKTTLFHLDASSVVMENRGLSQKDLGNFYFEVYSSEGLEVVNTGISARLNALANEKHSGLDDGILLQAYQELEVDKIITYDTDFEEGKRVTPEKVLEKF